MQSNQLVADEIVACGQAGRDRAGPALVAADELGNVPAARGLGVEEHGLAVAVEAGFVNLEPVGAAAVARGEVAGALVHPHDDGSLGVRPLAPDGLDAVAGLDTRRQGGRGAAVAAELAVRGGGNGVVVWPLALNHGVRVGREALVSGIREHPH